MKDQGGSGSFPRLGSKALLFLTELLTLAFKVSVAQAIGHFLSLLMPREEVEQPVLEPLS